MVCTTWVEYRARERDGGVQDQSLVKELLSIWKRNTLKFDALVLEEPFKSIILQASKSKNTLLQILMRNLFVEG